MLITVDDLKRRFADYNAMYFGGVLAMPKFSLNNWNNGIIGKFRNGRDKNGTPCQPHIRIAKYAAFTDETLKEILIHEMIHYYVVFIDGYDGLFSHGFRFRRIVRRLRREYGLVIPMNAKHIPYKNEKKKANVRKK